MHFCYIPCAVAFFCNFLQGQRNFLGVCPVLIYILKGASGAASHRTGALLIEIVCGCQESPEAQHDGIDKKRTADEGRQLVLQTGEAGASENDGGGSQARHVFGLDALDDALEVLRLVQLQHLQFAGDGPSPQLSVHDVLGEELLGLRVEDGHPLFVGRNDGEGSVQVQRGKAHRAAQQAQHDRGAGQPLDRGGQRVVRKTGDQDTVEPAVVEGRLGVLNKRQTRLAAEHAGLRAVDLRRGARRPRHVGHVAGASAAALDADPDLVGHGLRAVGVDDEKISRRCHTCRFRFRFRFRSRSRLLLCVSEQPSLRHGMRRFRGRAVRLLIYALAGTTLLPHSAILSNRGLLPLIGSAMASTPMGQRSPPTGQNSSPRPHAFAYA